MTGIEIGPLFQPVALKDEGVVIYVDHVDAKSLFSLVGKSRSGRSRLGAHVGQYRLR
jgi:hypothetical protein